MHRGTKLVLFALGSLLMPNFAAAQTDEIEMNIRNRTGESMTVFALWEGGTRDRLGDIRPNQTRSFTTEWRGDEVTLQVQVQGQRGRVGGDRQEDFAQVQPRDRINWDIVQFTPPDEFRDVEASLDLLYRHAGSTLASADVPNADGSAEPKMTTQLLRTQSGIQEAQGMEDDSLRTLAYRQVLVMVNVAIEEEDPNPMAYLHLAIAQAGLKNYFAADSAFDQAEALYPAYFEEDLGTGAYRLNAWLDAYTGALAGLDAQELEGALELFDIANMLYPNRVEAYLNIGITAGNLGNMTRSIEGWQGAIAVIESPDGNPGDEETRVLWDTDFWIMAQSNLGRLLTADGRAEEAVPVFEAILERFPENSDARSSLAMALAQSGQGDGALSIFDEILERDDAAPLDYYNAGVSLYAADQLERAVVAFEKTIARSPMYRDALQNLAQTLNQMEEYEAQIPYSERLIELDPFNDYAHLMHVRALVQVEREAEYTAALDVMQALPFIVPFLQLQPLPAGARVTGEAANKALDPGTTITLRFTFYDNDGNPVGTADTEVTISDPDVAHAFDVEFEGETQVLGYSYEFIG